jgi:hypothetical protein
VSGGPRVKLMTLWQRTSARGNPYFAGYLGGCGVVMFKDDQAELKPGCEAVWNIFLEERADSERRPRAAAMESRAPSLRSPKPSHHNEAAAEGRGASAPSKRRFSGRKAAESLGSDKPLPNDPLDDIGLEPVPHGCARLRDSS